jgi:choice-of-anchor C domain-containing protein
MQGIGGRPDRRLGAPRPQGIYDMAVIVSRVSSLFNDTNGDGAVSPGDSLITHIIIANNGASPITAVTIADTLNSHTTYVSGTIFVTVSDLYGQTGNTPEDYSAAQGLLANDFRGDSAGTLLVGSVNGSAVGGAPISVFDSVNNALLAGTVSAASDGSFTFTPAAGYTGTATFNYTTSDGSHTVGSATASIVVAGLVWYVQGGAATNGDGTFGNPFNNLASVSTVDHVNDTVVLHGTTTGGITLKGGETFYGDGSSFSVNNHTITNAGTDSVINHSAAGIVLASGNTIDGVDLHGTALAATGLTDGNGTVGTLTVNHMKIDGDGQILDIDQGGVLNVTLSSTQSHGFSTAAQGGAIDLQGVTGTFGVTNSTSIDTVDGGQASGGIDINATGLTATFGGIVGVNSGGTAGITLAGGVAHFDGGVGLNTAAGAALTTTGGTISIASGSTIQTSTGAAVNMSATTIGASNVTFTSINASGTVANAHGLNFNNVDGGTFNGGTVTVTGTSGTTGGQNADGIHIDNGSSATFTFGGTTIGGASSVAGDGIDINGAGNGAVSFGSVAINNVGGDGVKISNATSGVTISGGAIGNTNDPVGADLNINGGTGAVNVSATLTKTTAGNVVDISSHATGQIDISGAISATGAVDNGISIASVSSGVINVTGALTLTTGANTAIDMVGNSGGSYNFTNAAVNVTTTSGTGINMSSTLGTGPAVTFNGGNLTVSTTTGTAINAVDTNAGAATTPIGSLTISGANNTVAQSGAGGSAATAININGVAEAITLKSVNVGASGQSGNTAISLQNAGASGAGNFFQIQGTGAANSGGTINHAAGGADLATSAGIGIYLNNVGNISLNDLKFSGVYDNYGIFGKSVNNFTLTNTDFTPATKYGTQSANGNYEGVVTFGSSSGGDGSGNGLTGTASFQGNNFANAYANTVGIFDNYDSSKTLAQNALILNFGTTAANTLGVMQAAAGQTANDALSIQARGNGTVLGQGFNLTANIGNTTSGGVGNNFNDAVGDLLQVNSLGNSTSTINITNNKFINVSTTQLSGGGGVSLTQGGDGSVVNYNVTNNTFKGATGFELLIAEMGFSGTSTGEIQSNTFGQPDGVYQTNPNNPNGVATYGLGGVGGIWLHNERQATGTGTQTSAVHIDNNLIGDYSGNSGIVIWSNNAGGASGAMNTEVSLRGNTVKDPSANNGFTSLELDVAQSGTPNDNGSLGIFLSGNTLDNHLATTGDNAIDMLLGPTAKFYVDHYTGAKTGLALTTYLQTVSANVPVANTLVNGGAPNTTGGSAVDTTGNSPGANWANQNFSLTVPLELAPQYGTDWESQLQAPQPDMGSKPVSDPTVTTGAGDGGSTGSGGGTTPPPAPPPAPVLATLDQSTLDTMVAAAIHRWELAGATPEQIAAMKAVSVTVSDMAGIQIGASNPGVVQIDSDAGGYGWFVDQSPGDDAEFTGTGSDLHAAAGSDAVGHVDLLTVIEHELGHQIGLNDDYNPADSADVMFGYLDLGERRLATADDVKAATGTPVDHEAFALSPVLVGSIPGGGKADVSFQSLVDSSFAPGLAPHIGGTSTVTFGANTLTAIEDISSVNDTLTSSVPTVTHQSLAVESLTLGDLVYQDVNKNGTFDAGDTGIGNVTVQLYIDNGTTAGVWDGSDTLVGSTTTSNVVATKGQYSFTGLAPGDYIVVISGYGALVPHQGAVDPDGSPDVDNDNNGFDAGGGNVASHAITLTYGGESGTNGDTNNTLDFGLQVNSPPTAINQTLAATDEDTPKNYQASDFTTGDSDPDGDTFSLTSVTNGAHGTASLSAGVVTYTPNANYNGSDTFTYTITDSHGATATANATVSIDAVNDPVTGTVPATATVDEDSSGNAITGMSISDVDTVLAPAGVYSVTLSATHGTLTLTTLTGLTFSGGSDGTADATMTFTGTLANINTALASAHYTPDANFNGAAQIQLDVTDTDGVTVATGTGSATSDSDVIAVTVNSVNDEPVGTDSSDTTIENVVLVLATTDFSNGFSDPIDGNGFAGVKITVLPATGTLKLNNVAISANDFISKAELDLGHLTYTPPGVGSAGTDPTFKFEVRDDGGTLHGGVDTDQSPNTFTLHLTPSDIAPVLDLDTVAAGIDNSASYTEQAAPTVLASGLSLTDADDTDLTGATVSVGTGFIANADYLSVNGATSGTFNGISYSYNAATGVLSFTGTGTVSDYQTLLQQVGFESTSDAPGTSRDIAWSATDGTLPSTTAHTTITVTPVEDAPALIAQTADQHVNEDTAVNFSVSSAFTDPDGDSLTYTATLGDGSPLPGWLSFNTGTQTFTGTPPQDFNGTIALKVVASDGTLSTPETFNLIIDPVNDNPVLNAAGTSFNYTENAPAHALFTSLSVSDVDNANFNGGTLTIVDASADPGDSLAIGSDPDITFTPVDATHGTIAYQGNTFGNVTISSSGYSIALNANATPAAIHALLADLGYVNTSDDPVGGDHAITVTLTDGSGGSANFVTHVNVIPVNDNPSILNVNGDTITFTENNQFAYADTGATAPTNFVVPGPGNGLVVDPDSHDFNGGQLTVTIASGYVAGQDHVAFVGFNAITAGQISFDGAHNVYYGSTAIGTYVATGQSQTVTFNANATAANITALIHQFGYFNSSDDPNTSDRGLQFTLTDGDGGTTSVLTTVHVAAVNDAPVNTVPLAQSVNEDATLIFDSAHTNAITVSDIDVESGNLTTTVSVLHGTVSLGSTAGVTVTGNNSASVQVTGTPANVNAALAGLGYHPTANYNGGDTMTVLTTDNGNTGGGGAKTDTDTVAITVNPMNDQPVVTPTATVGETEQTAVVLNPSWSASDVDLDALNGGNGDYAGGSIVINRNGGANAEDTFGFSASGATFTVSGGNLQAGGQTFATFTSSGGTLQITFTGTGTPATTALVNNVLDHIQYTNTSDAPPASVPLVYTFNDGAPAHGQGTVVGGNNLASGSVTVNITAVNDAPVNGVPGAQSVAEDGSKTFNSANSNLISVSDPDVGGGNLTTTLTVAHGTITLSGTAGLAFTTGTGTANTTMTFTGTAAAINAALDGLVYTPTANFNGADSLSVLTSDLGNTGTGGIKTDSDAVAITVTAVNDAPTVVNGTSATATTISEDHPSATGDTVSSLFASHYSDAIDQVAGGSSANPFAGVAVTANPSSNATGHWQYLNGATWTDIPTTASDASAFLLSATTAVRFNPALNFSGQAPALTVHLIDGSSGAVTSANIVDLSAPGATGGTTRYSTQTMDLHDMVNSVNDAPVNGVPANQTVNEDAPLVFSTANSNAIQVTDSDAASGTLTMILTVQHGTLTLPNHLNVTVSGDGTDTLQISGSQADITAVLDGLTYQGAHNYFGSDALNIFTSDNGNTGTGGPQTDSDTVGITINPMNDQPVVTAAASVGETEQTPVVLDPSWSASDADLDAKNGGNGDYAGASLAIGRDAGADPEDTFAFNTTGASFTVVGSSLQSGGQTFASFTNVGGVLNISFTSAGTAATTALVNDVLKHIQYTNTSDTPPASVLLDYNFNDGSPGHGQGTVVGGNNLAAGAITVNITAVDDAPVNHVPGAQTINEDASQTFSAANSNAITVSDVDVGGGNVSVTLSVGHGILTLGSTANVTAPGNGTGSVTVTGTLTDVNTALDGLVYTPTGDFNGDDTIHIVTSDLGNTGTGGPLTDTDDVIVHVTAVNDAPVASGSATAPAIDEDSPSATGDTVGSLFAANYSDAADNQSAYGGSSAGAFTGVAITGNASSGATGQWQYWNGASWVDVGAVSDASALTLAAGTAIRFNPAQDYNGAAPALTVHLADNTATVTDGAHIDISAPGATGGTTPWSTGTVALSETINAVDDAPVNHVPGAQTFHEDTSQTFSAAHSNAITVSDVDANGGNVTVTLDVGHGTLTLGSTAGVSATGDGTDTVQLTGTVANVNAALDGLVYAPDANFNGDDTIHIVTDDNGNSGSGSANTDTDDVTLHVTAVNDAPVVVNGGAATAPAIDEDTPSATGDTVSSLFGSHFSDATDDVPGGSSANNFAGVAVTGNGSDVNTGHWQYWNGASWVDIPTTVSNDAAFVLSATTFVRFNPAQDYNGTAPALTVHLIDDSAGPVTTGDTANLTTLIVNGDFENGAAIPNGSFTEPHAGDPSITGWTIVSGDVDYINGYWQASSGTRSIDLNGDQPGAIAQTFTTVPGEAYTVTFDVAGSPGQAGPHSLQASAGDTTQVFTVDSTGNSNANMGYVSQTFTFIATSTSTTLTFASLDAGPYGPVLDHVVVQGTQYSAGTVALTETVNPVNDPAVLDLNGAAAGTSTTASYTEGHTYTVIAPSATVSDVDMSNYDNGVLTLAFTANGTVDDQLVILDQGAMNTGNVSVSGNDVYYQFGYIVATGNPANPFDYSNSDIRLVGTFTGGNNGSNLVITFNDQANAAVAQAVLADIGFEDVSQNPSVADRTVTATLVESDGTTSNAPTVTIHVFAVNTPSVPNDDYGTTDEVHTVAIPVLNNDSDVDGPPPSVAKINGQSVNPGDTVVLASGALATLNANGTITYDPYHRFDTLTSPSGGETGALNTQGSDSFTYTTADGQTATVNVNIDGVAGPGDWLRGGPGDDTITGTPGNDLFMLQDGGNDSASGLGGGDAFYYGGALTSGDSNDGGAGRDVVILQGDYAAGVVLGAHALDNIEALSVQSGSVTRWGDTANNHYSYDITSVDSNVAAGTQLIVNGQSLLTGENFTFNGSAETDGAFLIYGGNGTDHLTGGAGGDIFDFEGTRWNASDMVDGGAGRDVVIISGVVNGMNNVVVGAGQLTNIEALSFSSRYAATPASAPSYNVTLNDGNVMPGGTLIVNASSLTGVLQTFALDAHTVTGNLWILGGSSTDTIVAGSGNDIVYGGLGQDDLTGGAGADTFQFKTLQDSTTGAADHILDFTSGTDKIDLSAIDANPSTPGNDAFVFSNDGTFHGINGEVREFFDAAHGWWVVDGDVNGDGQADFTIHVTTQGNVPLVSTDFIL